MNSESTSHDPVRTSMAPYQRVVIGLCMLFNLIDGLDVLAMAFTAGSVSTQWHLSGVQTGMLLSAGLIGMACGSMIAAPVAARYGRLALLVLSLTVSGLGMLASYISPNYESLLYLRGVTGLGVGVILVIANVLTYEHASEHWRGLAVALQSGAFALGAVLCGALANFLNDSAGWRYVFLSGGCMTLGAAVVAMLWFRDSQQSIALIHEAHHPLNCDAKQRQWRGKAFRHLFSEGQWQQTCTLASAFFLLMFSFYFVMSWTPTLLIQNGFSGKNGTAGGILLNAGGMLGALLVGLGANRFGCTKLLLSCLSLNAVLMVLMVPITRVPGLSIAAGCMTGLLLNGAVAALFSLSPKAFNTPIRTSGVGLVLATGRLGAILSPVVAGQLLDAHWKPQSLFSLYAVSLLLASLLLWLPRRRA